jgi:hypothetical protein
MQSIYNDDTYAQTVKETSPTKMARYTYLKIGVLIVFGGSVLSDHLDAKLNDDPTTVVIQSEGLSAPPQPLTHFE